MSGRVGSASSPNVNEVNFTEVESEPIAVPARTQSQPQGSQVEAWLGERPATNFAPYQGGAVSSGQELAAQSAREAVGRQVSLKALGGLEGPLARLAQQYPDPISFFGNTQFKNKDVSLGAFGAAVRDEKFDKAVGTLSTSDVRASVEAQVKKAWPKSSPEQVEKLKQYFMAQICESVRERVAPKLQEAVTSKLEGAASDFKKAASDPAQLKQLAERLNAMTHPVAAPWRSVQRARSPGGARPQS